MCPSLLESRKGETRMQRFLETTRWLLLLPLLLTSCVEAAPLGEPDEVENGGSMGQTVQTRVIASAEGPIELTSEPVGVSLTMASGAQDEEGARQLSQLLATLEPTQRLFLKVQDFEATESPGVLYHLYLGLPPGATPAKDDPRHAGTVNFYAAVPTKKGFVSFDVTDLLQRLRREEVLSMDRLVTVIPAGTPEAGVPPTLGRIELVLEDRST